MPPILFGMKSSMRIVWDEIVDESIDNILTSQDGAIMVVELLNESPDGISSEDVRAMIEADIDNWTAPLT
jgi:hypothetical protein